MAKKTVVRVPGHWLIVGTVDRIDSAEIRLTDASNIRNDSGGMGKNMKFGPLDPIGDVIITNGPGIFYFDLD